LSLSFATENKEIPQVTKKNLSSAKTTKGCEEMRAITVFQRGMK